MFFSDRTDAGRQLAARLDHLKGHDVVVLGLPRGGVPVAAEVADALDAPLDICLVRKLGVPAQPELAMGALGEGGVRVVNERVLREVGVEARDLAAVERREHIELDQRALRYRGSRPSVPLEGRTVLVVDDGLATGATALAACRVVRAGGAARIVLAVPVAPQGWTARLGGEADETVSVHTPEVFYAIGQFYQDFSQTPDAEVVACLDRNRAAHGPVVTDTDVRIPVAKRVTLAGTLAVPEGATGIVVFAHGSGSGRHSPRNREVASALNAARLGTLLFDLLTEAEAVDRAHVFDTPLLAERLTRTTEWLAGRQSRCHGLAPGLGGGEGAAPVGDHEPFVPQELECAADRLTVDVVPLGQGSFRREPAAGGDAPVGEVLAQRGGDPQIERRVRRRLGIGLGHDQTLSSLSVTAWAGWVINSYHWSKPFC